MRKAGSAPKRSLFYGRSIIATAIGLAMLMPVATQALAHAETKVHTLTPGVLSIGTYFVNPPFEFISKGRKTGFEIDLMKQIAHRLRLRPVFVNTQWEVILQQMQEGRYDCIVGGITITPARSQVLAWSDPYTTTTLSLIVNTIKTPAIQDLADFKDATVGVQAATTDYDAAIAMRQRGEIKAVKVYPFARIAEAITDLSAGHITAVMKVYPVAAWLVREAPGLRIVAQVPNDPQPLGIGLNKGNPTLLAAVNRTLEEMKRDGSGARLARKWNVSVNDNR